ncbi:MAG: hypothetical protein M3P51_12535 [Chloroflexota bacterium]|nr:hypothetical protein [Chloroflexota bacterium]
MSPEMGQAGFRIGCLMVVPSVVMLFLLQPGTAEHSITVIMLGMGLIFLAVLTGIILRSQR